MSLLLPYNVTQLKNIAAVTSNLFLIHPAGAAATFYKNFSNSLNVDINIYSIESPFLFGKYKQIINLQELSLIYFEYIKNIQKKGPYFLGGASFGGVVAHNIADILEQSGEEVKCLFMIDSPYLNKNLLCDVKEIEIFAYIFDINLEEIKDNKFFDLRIINQIEFLQNTGKYKVLTNFSLSQVYKIFKVTLDNITSLRNHVPNKINQKILFFKPKFTESLGLPSFLSIRFWQEKTSELLEFEALGNHKSMNYNPYVTNITQVLEMFILREISFNRRNHSCSTSN